MNVNNYAVAERIKEIRLSNGWTLEEMGKKLDTSKVSVYNWESGRNLPNKERLKAIAELGDMSVNELLYGSPRDYFFSVFPNDDIEDLDVAYELYLIQYKDEPYQSKETILNFYENTALPISKEIDKKVNESFIFGYSYSAYILIGLLRENIKENDIDEKNKRLLDLAISELDFSFEAFSKAHGLEKQDYKWALERLDVINDENNNILDFDVMELYDYIVSDMDE